MTVADMLLTRQGLISLVPGSSTSPPTLLRAIDVEVAALGYAVSDRLRQRLATLAPDDLARTWILDARRAGGEQRVRAAARAALPRFSPECSGRHF